MKTLTTHITTTLEIKQSKFIAHICAFDEYENMLETLRDEHPKARHFVKAFRYLNEFEQVVEGSSDDGEPKGTSGKPSLAVLAGNELINVGVVIVRYFGGTKLGTGGLVRAYGEAVNRVIEASKIEEFVKEIDSRFTCSYSNFSIIEYDMQKFSLHVKDKTFNADSIELDVSATAENIEAFYQHVDRLITR